MSLTIAVPRWGQSIINGTGNSSRITPSTYAFIQWPQNPSGRFSLFQVFSSNRSLHSRSQDDLNLFGEYYIGFLRIVKTMETKSCRMKKNNSCHTAALHTELWEGSAMTSTLALPLVLFSWPWWISTDFFSLLVGKFSF